jgi:hypothetical protein
MQIVFLAGTTNENGEYVFGNSDMAVCLPDEKYQHFYEGLPSTNGLSGKWINEVVIFSGEPPVMPDQQLPDGTNDGSELPVIPIVIGVAGVVILAVSAVVIFRRK